MSRRRPLSLIASTVWVTVLSLHAVPDLRSNTQAQESPLARARQALGGEQRIAAIRSLAMSGVRNNATTSTIEYRMVFPDQFVRVEVNERLGYKAHTGFNGSTPILDRRPVTRAKDTFFSGLAAPPDDHVDRQRMGLAQLLIGMLADSKHVLDVKYQPKDATTISVTGPGNFSGTLELDAATGVPARFRYSGEVHVPELAATPDANSRRTKVFASRKGEITLTFEDRRDVNGVLLPHRILRTIPGQTLEELRLERIALNPQLDAASFRVQ